MNTNTPLVVLSEDDEELARILQKQMENSGMDVRTFHNGSGIVEFL
jgi:DNA-binding response OmpR family regulator